uniref:Uncharacterized protein LOC111133651 isoform X2 n=1 Tax=Crassostrea virginica TaxID=6565 RepID=A0A8B8EEA3_CRAVI|nr:uncharacterized protein LOC111133651 isoform X2 [Crassostrea virginica]
MSYQKVYMNQIYSSSIMRQVAQMWKNQLLCDAVIKTGNFQTKAHRLVLIAACPMLQDRENASVGSHLEVSLNSDISQASVNTFLQYLYEGYMMLSEDNCREVEKIAKMLHVDSISKCCSDFQKCMAAKMGYRSNQALNFDLQDNPDFRFVNTTDLRKMVPEGQNKREIDESNSPTSLSKRPRSQTFSSLGPHRPDDHLSMNDSYNSSNSRDQHSSQGEGVIDITGSSVELVNIGPGARDSEGWPINSDLPPLTTSSSLAVTNQQKRSTDVQIIEIPPVGGDKTSRAAFGRIHDSKNSTLVAGISTERTPNVPGHSPSVTRHKEDSTQYVTTNSARENIPRLSPLRSSPPKLVQKQRGAMEDLGRPFALGSAVPDHRHFPIQHSNSSIQPVDIIQNTSLYADTQKTDTGIHRKTHSQSNEEQRARDSPEPIIVKLEDETGESGSMEMYIQNPSNESYSQDPGGDSLGEMDLSNDDSYDLGQPYSTQEEPSQDHNSNGDFIDRELSYDERIQYALQQRRRRAHGRARGKQKPGPKPTTVRLKFYLLPSGCDLPKFSRQDPIIDTHMSQGYGYPAGYYENAKPKHHSIRLDLDDDAFKENIRSLYTNLTGKDFSLSIINQQREMIAAPFMPRFFRDMRYQGTVVITMKESQRNQSSSSTDPQDMYILPATSPEGTTHHVVTTTTGSWREPSVPAQSTTERPNQNLTFVKREES